ncbi:MAG TPA: calcium-binding protein, partial [Allosphingosinicella sp.]|nr:calcium-binding protein [Allosphingosinicella sp.]
MALIRKKGGEAYVNAEKANAQTSPAIAALTGGGHVVAWADESHVGGDSSGFAIKLQLYDGTGAKTGGELLVNSFTGDSQTQPSVAGLASGGFVVTWTQNEPSAALGGDGSAASIKGQIYSSAGVKVGGEFLVNSGISWIQDESAVFALTGGGFVVSWWDHGTFNVFARVFDSTGAALGDDILVSNDRQGNQSLPSGTAFGDAGGFVIMWSHQDFGPTYDQGVYGQIFAADGTKIGGEFSVSTVTDNIQANVEVTRLAGGGFVAVWESLEGEDYGIKAQVFDSSGAKSGAEVAVSLAGHHGERPSVTALPQGGFFVAWADLRLGTWTERGQQFDAAGSKVGPDIQINSVASPFNAFPRLATLASGEVEAVWSNENGGNAEQLGIKAQRLLMPIVGTAGADAIGGTGGDDLIAGLEGDDHIDGAAGADTMVGGTGNDLYVVDHAGDVVEENAGEGTDEIRTSLASFSLVGLPDVENLTGTASTAQSLRGNSGNNVITGGSGSDVLRLYDGGDDIVQGGAGADNIFFIGALTAADVVNGGSNTDTLVLQGPYGSLVLTANVTQIENISLLAGSNTAFGEPGTNRYDYSITTNDANFAAGVQARINGAALLEGEDFTFDGSAETDAKFVVYGGKGKDTLTGGLGNDIFFYAEERFATGDTVNGGAGYDGMFLRG